MNLVRWLEALLQADRFEDVVRAAEAETARFPDYPSLRIVLARAYMGLGRWDLARQHLEEVLRRDAAHLRAWEALVETCAAQDRWDDVGTCLENLEMLGWEPEKLRSWKERLTAHRPPTPTPSEPPQPTPPEPVEAPGPPAVEVPSEAEPVPPSLREVWPPGWALAGTGFVTWTDAWTAAQPAGSFFRRQGVPPEDPAWYNLTVYWSRLSSKGGKDE